MYILSTPTRLSAHRAAADPSTGHVAQRAADKRASLDHRSGDVGARSDVDAALDGLNTVPLLSSLPQVHFLTSVRRALTKCSAVLLPTLQLRSVLSKGSSPSLLAVHGPTAPSLPDVPHTGSKFERQVALGKVHLCEAGVCFPRADSRGVRGLPKTDAD